jgi:hypothetical protein
VRADALLGGGHDPLSCQRLCRHLGLAPFAVKDRHAMCRSTSARSRGRGGGHRRW